MFGTAWLLALRLRGRNSLEYARSAAGARTLLEVILAARIGGPGSDQRTRTAAASPPRFPRASGEATLRERYNADENDTRSAFSCAVSCLGSTDRTASRCLGFEQPCAQTRS
jgi:hypothetical protein